MVGQLQPFSWTRMNDAVARVCRCLLSAMGVPSAAGVPYTVTDGSAVAAWVLRVNGLAVRNTQDVNVLIRRADLPAVTSALQACGFVHHHANQMKHILDTIGE